MVRNISKLCINYIDKDPKLSIANMIYDDNFALLYFFFLNFEWGGNHRNFFIYPRKPLSESDKKKIEIVNTINETVKQYINNITFETDTFIEIEEKYNHAHHNFRFEDFNQEFESDINADPIYNHGVIEYLLIYNLSVKCYETGHYALALKYSLMRESLITYVAGQKSKRMLDCINHFLPNTAKEQISKKFVIAKNAKNARQRWGDKVEQQRQRYLQHYKDKGFTTYKACAMWIWENDNPEQLDLDTIKIHLSKADKEQAKQKQNKIQKK